jgi:hypothetical protein
MLLAKRLQLSLSRVLRIVTEGDGAIFSKEKSIQMYEPHYGWLRIDEKWDL